MVLYAVNPELRTAEGWVGVLQRSGQPVLLGYLMLSVVRPFTLVPSTVLIVVGTLLFPTQPWFVGVSSLAGVVASASLIYFFFEFLGLAELLERKHAAQVRRLEGQMRRKGFWVLPGRHSVRADRRHLLCRRDTPDERGGLSRGRGARRAADRGVLRRDGRVALLWMLGRVAGPF